MAFSNFKQDYKKVNKHRKDYDKLIEDFNKNFKKKKL